MTSPFHTQCSLSPDAPITNPMTARFSRIHPSAMVENGSRCPANAPVAHIPPATSPNKVAIKIRRIRSSSIRAEPHTPEYAPRWQKVSSGQESPLDTDRRFIDLPWSVVQGVPRFELPCNIFPALCDLDHLLVRNPMPDCLNSQVVIAP